MFIADTRNMKYFQGTRITSSSLTFVFDNVEWTDNWPKQNMFVHGDIFSFFDERNNKN